jgi:DNA-binding CsgD family transcriptional regulator
MQPREKVGESAISPCALGEAGARYREMSRRRSLSIRPLSEAERACLQAGLHAPSPLVRRRCRILLASAQGQPPAQIARAVDCSPQTVRTLIHRFTQDGLPLCLLRRSRRAGRLTGPRVILLVVLISSRPAGRRGRGNGRGM